MTQGQREALLDLLILGIFVDAKLSVAEDAALEGAFKVIGWDGAQPRDVFICRSLSRAWRVRDSEGATGAYINSRTTAFTDEDSRVRGSSFWRRFLWRTGWLDCEAEFLARVKGNFS